MTGYLAPKISRSIKVEIYFKTTITKIKTKEG